MRDHVPFDPVRDFTPAPLAISSPNVLVVHPSLRVKMVKSMAGVNITAIADLGASLALTDMLVRRVVCSFIVLCRSF